MVSWTLYFFDWYPKCPKWSSLSRNGPCEPSNIKKVADICLLTPESFFKGNNGQREQIKLSHTQVCEVYTCYFAGLAFVDWSRAIGLRRAGLFNHIAGAHSGKSQKLLAMNPERNYFMNIRIFKFRVLKPINIF